MRLQFKSRGSTLHDNVRRIGEVEHTLLCAQTVAGFKTGLSTFKQSYDNTVCIYDDMQHVHFLFTCTIGHGPRFLITYVQIIQAHGHLY